MYSISLILSRETLSVPMLRAKEDRHPMALKIRFHI